MARRRRGRRPEEYARRAPVREPYDYILIVCEGGKTEPNYFKRLCAVYGLSNANVEITPADGTDPVSVVNFAIAKHDEHDRVYCVFDRNGHANFNAALDLVSQSALGKNGVLRAITSTPCFEVWVLFALCLQHGAVQQGWQRLGLRQGAEAIRPHFGGYAKGSKNVYDTLTAKLDAAIKNAVQLGKHNKTSASLNPATGVHDLVEYLRNLKPKPKTAKSNV